MPYNNKRKAGISGRSLKIEFLSDKTFPLICRFSERVWNRPQTDEYYRWRYLKAPGHKTLIISNGGECKATVSVFVKHYNFCGEKIECFEMFDWYCLPERRGSGLGIRVLKHLMDLGQPVIGFGGSQDTLSLLPRLGFKKLTEGNLFVLPLSGGYICNWLQKKNSFIASIGERVFDLVGKAYFRPSFSKSNSCNYTIPGSAIQNDIVLSLYKNNKHNITSIPDPAFLEWLIHGFPGAGRFIPFHFMNNGHPCGWGLGRVFFYNGRLIGSICDFYIEESSSDVAYDALMSLTSTLAGFGVEHIRTRVTCPFVQKVLRKCRFLPKERFPVMIWFPNRLIPDGTVNLMEGVGDGAFFPLSTDNYEEKAL